MILRISALVVGLKLARGLGVAVRGPVGRCFFGYLAWSEPMIYSVVTK